MSADPNFAARLQVGEEIATLLANTLTAASPSTNFTQLYTTGLALQFRSNLHAVLILLSHGFDSEAWTIARSMTEILVRVKWIHKRKSHAAWLTLGKELADRNRFASYKSRSRLRIAAVAAIDERVAEVLPRLPKNARYWQKNRPGRLCKPPSIEKMAKECGMLKLYRGFFKWGSDHSHAAHAILERFMTLDAKGDFTGTFVLVPPPDELASTSHYILAMAAMFVGFLRKYGWPVNEGSYKSIAGKFFALRPRGT
jgi:Family of unknown function (DUF5677)